MNSFNNQFIKNKIQKNNLKHIRFNDFLSYSSSNQYLNHINLYKSNFNINYSSNIEINNIINLDTIFLSLHNNNNNRLCNKEISTILKKKDLKQLSIISNILNFDYPHNKNLL
ncbi:unnamed protein product [Schistosoma rodhaini]|nr:unnamed protein product [Schistosoma rodhaini]